MQQRMTAWSVVAVLATCVLGVSAGDDPERKDAAGSLQLEIDRAWREAGAELGWVKDVPPRAGAHSFWRPWRDRGELGTMPAFRFPGRKAGGVLAKLPDPGMAFGLDFHCGFYAGVTLKEVAELKNLESLNIGGVPGNTYADLKELAGLKNLRALYLFYLPVTDAQLKHLAGLTKLQTLDLTWTRVTDVGLKELSGLTRLQALNLSGTMVTDAGLRELAALKRLQWLRLKDTGVTDAAVKELGKQLAGCRIER